MHHRQRRTRPLHPAKVSDYAHTSTARSFSFKVKHFFVEPELVAESYPYDRGIIHSKGCMIPYFEYCGLGDPPNYVGIPGDVWIDSTPGLPALHVRGKAKWTPFPASDFAERTFIQHPFVSARVLWCTPKAVGWSDQNTARRHWTATKKELGGEFGERALVDMLEEILSAGEEEVAAAEGSSGGNGDSDAQENVSTAVNSGVSLANDSKPLTKSHTHSDAPASVAAKNEPGPEDDSNSDLAKNAVVELIVTAPPGSDEQHPNEEDRTPVMRTVELSDNNGGSSSDGIGDGDPNDNPARDHSVSEDFVEFYRQSKTDSFCDVPMSSLQPDTVDDVIESSQDVPVSAPEKDSDGNLNDVPVPEIIPAVTDTQAQEASPSCQPVLCTPPDLSSLNDVTFREPALSISKFQAQITVASHESASPCLKSSISETLHRITAQAISRRQHATTPSDLPQFDTNDSNLTQGPPFSSSADIISHSPSVDSPSTSDSLFKEKSNMDCDVPNNSPPQSEPLVSINFLARSPSLPHPQISVQEPSPQQSGPSPSVRPVEKTYRSTSVGVSMESPALDILPTSSREENDRLEKQQEQIQQLLHDLRHLQAEVTLLKDANRKLQNGRAVQEHVDDTVRLSDEQQISTEMQEMVSSVVNSLNRGITFFSAKFQAERAARMKMSKQLKRAQAALKELSVSEGMMETEFDGDMAGSSMSTKSTLTAEEDAEPSLVRPTLSPFRLASGSNVTPTLPSRLATVFGPSPSYSQSGAEYASDSTLNTPSPIRVRGNARPPGYAIALRRAKAAHKLMTTGEGNDSETRPTKRPRISLDGATPRPSHDPEASADGNSTGTTMNVSPARPPGQIGFQHLDILYLSARDLKHCRVCLIRQRKNTGFSPLTFPFDTDAGTLIKHCESEHPVACEKLVNKHDDELIKIRKQVERTDAQLLDTMEVEEE